MGEFYMNLINKVPVLILRDNTSLLIVSMDFLESRYTQ